MENVNNKGIIPVADRISSWGLNIERKILFKCPKCSISFGYYEEQEKFCHNCGQKINWKGLTYNLITDENLIQECMNSYEKQKEVIDKINTLNGGCMCE